MVSKARSISPHVFSDLVEDTRNAISNRRWLRYEMMKYAKLRWPVPERSLLRQPTSAPP
jgi:hypothetical protein